MIDEVEITEEMRSLPIGFPVNKSAETQVQGLAAALLTQNAPCYGRFSKEDPRCLPTACVLRDMCRVAQGGFAATLVSSMTTAEIEVSRPPPAVPVTSAGPKPAKKGVVRKDGVVCARCGNAIEVGSGFQTGVAGEILHLKCEGE